MSIAHVTLTFDSRLNKSPCTLPQGQLAPTELEDRLDNKPAWDR